MAEKTKIDWATSSFNFWQGCSATTNPGCDICYAVRRVLPRQGIGEHTVRRTSADHWKEPLRWQRKAKEAGTTQTVFANSLSDFFHSYADIWRDEAWDIIRQTPNLQWIILTQRIERVAAHLPKDWGLGWPNVWLGVSASDQAHADKRIPRLLEIPAALHLVSLEPLKEAVTLHPEWLPKLDWVITGGASGDEWTQWRLLPKWIINLRNQCVNASIPFFFKQLGGPAENYRNGDQALLEGRLWQQVPEPTCVLISSEVQSRLL